MVLPTLSVKGGTGCFFASAGFFSASFWGHSGKGRASPKVLFCQHDCWREEARASPKVFFCQRVGCQKRPRPGKGVILPGHGGVFLPAHLSPSASPRRNAVEERCPCPVRAGKNAEKINFETWALREKLHNPALQHREVSSVDRSMENPKLEGCSGGTAGKFLRSTSSVSSTCQIQHCDAEIEWVVPSTIQHSQKQNV